MPNPSAVITGDIIGSRTARFQQLEDSFAALEDAATRYGAQQKFAPRFTRHRGDGWQILVSNAADAMDAFLALTAKLRAADTGLSTKTAIGIGPIISTGTNDLSDASGPAFIASGDALETLGKTAIRTSLAGPDATDWQAGIIRMIDTITQGWSAHQAEAVALKLLRADLTTNAARADALGISRQAYEARLNSSLFHSFSEARAAFRNHFNAMPA